MIKKIAAGIFIFIAATAFAQKTVDLIGAPESFQFIESKFALTKATKNPDKTITQEYSPIRSDDQVKDQKKKTDKSAKPASTEKITVVFLATEEPKALLEKKISEISRIRYNENVNVQEKDNGGYNLTYVNVNPTTKKKEQKTLYFKSIKQEKGFSSYVFEYDKGDRKQLDELDTHLFKFVESFPNL